MRVLQQSFATAIGIVFFAAGLPAPAESLFDTQKILAEDALPSDLFGRQSAVAFNGNTALVGSLGSDLRETGGATYVFIRDGIGEWSQQATLLPADITAENLFGWYVALDTDTALISAVADDDNGARSGSVYVFVRDETGIWSQQTKLLASDGEASDFFGQSVALDGDTALIGADRDGDNGELSGSAYVFVRDESGIWTEQAKLLPGDGAPKDVFGVSVAVQGNTAVVGADRDDDNGTDSGSVYVFARDAAGVWSQQAKLVANDGATEDGFGGAIALDKGTILIGAAGDDDLGRDSGSAYVFRRDGAGTWLQEAKIRADDGATEDSFGLSAALDGTMAVIGAPGDDDGGVDSGSAYLFSRDSAGSWNRQRKFLATASEPHDNFGVAVALDGATVLVGMPGDDDNGADSGSVFVFTEIIDSDSDGIGDHLDEDDDNDGIDDLADNCPLHVNSGQSDSDADGLGNECDNTPFPTPAGTMQVVSDLDGDGTADIGMLRRGSIFIETRLSGTGRLHGIVEFFDDRYTPVNWFSSKPATNSRDSELSVFASRDDGVMQAQSRSAGDGSLTSTIGFLSPSFEPVKAVPLGDVSGNGSDDIAVLAIQRHSQAILVQVKDTAAGARIAEFGALSPEFEPLDIVGLPDMDANGFAEIGILAVRKADGRFLVHVTNLGFDPAKRNIWFTGPGYVPISMRAGPDVDGNGMPDILILMKRLTDNRFLVQARNGFGPKEPENYWFLSEEFEPVDFAIVQPPGALQPLELAMLAGRLVDQRIVVQFRPLDNQSATRTIWFMNSDYAANSIHMLGDLDGNWVNDIGVGAVDRESGRPRLEIRNADGEPLPRNVWFDP